MMPATVMALVAPRAGRPDRGTQVFTLDLPPDPADQEDVVIGAQGEQQDRACDGNEEGQLAVAEQILERRKR